MHEMLNPEQLARIDDGYCIDCHWHGFVLGPMARSPHMRSTNIECGNFKCRARFNVTSELLSHHIIMGHRIEKESEGGASWQRVKKESPGPPGRPPA